MTDKRDNGVTAGTELWHVYSRVGHGLGPYMGWVDPWVDP